MRYSVLALVLILTLTACQGNRKADKTGQTSDGFPAPNQELVYRAAENAVRERGYAVDRDLSCPQRGFLQTRWHTQLAPFSGQGTRDRVTVRITEMPNRESYYQVETNVIRETNMNLVDPTNPVMAEWKQPTRVGDLENLITRRIEMHFLTGEVSEEFRYRHGLPTNTTRIENMEPVQPKKENNDPLGLGLGFP